MKYRTTPLAAALAVLLLPVATMAADGKKPEDTSAQKTEEAVACTQITGSRIRPSKADVASGRKCATTTQPTRSYSKDELDTTGEMSVGDALRKLDPAFL